MERRYGTAITEEDWKGQKRGIWRASLSRCDPNQSIAFLLISLEHLLQIHPLNEAPELGQRPLCLVQVRAFF